MPDYLLKDINGKYKFSRTKSVFKFDKNIYLADFRDYADKTLEF